MNVKQDFKHFNEILQYRHIVFIAITKQFLFAVLIQPFKCTLSANALKLWEKPHIGTKTENVQQKKKKRFREVTLVV